MATIPSFDDIQVIDENGFWTPEYKAIIQLLFNSLQSNIGNEGVVIPSLTSSEISQLKKSSNGTVVYNSTNNVLEANINGEWREINLPSTVPISQGGTGETTQQGAINNLVGSVTRATYLRGDGSDAVMSSINPDDVPILNQNTTGTASNVTGIVSVSNGGTGLNSLTTSYGVICAGTTPTGNFQNAGSGISGQVLTSNGPTSLPSFQSTSISGLSLIDTQITSATNSVMLTGLSPGILYKLVYNIKQGSTAGNLKLGFNSNFSANYKYVTNFSIYNSSGQSGTPSGNNITFFPLINGTNDPLASSSNAIGEILIYQSDSSSRINIRGNIMYVANNTGLIVIGNVGGYADVGSLFTLQIYENDAGAVFDCSASIYKYNQ